MTTKTSNEICQLFLIVEKEASTHWFELWSFSNVCGFLKKDNWSVSHNVDREGTVNQ